MHVFKFYPYIIFNNSIRFGYEILNNSMNKLVS